MNKQTLASILEDVDQTTAMIDLADELQSQRISSDDRTVDSNNAYVEARALLDVSLALSAQHISDVENDIERDTHRLDTYRAFTEAPCDRRSSFKGILAGLGVVTKCGSQASPEIKAELAAFDATDGVI